MLKLRGDIMEKETDRKLSSEELENLVYDIIKFCKDYNLWNGVKIYASGKSYASYPQKELLEKQRFQKGFREFEDVYVHYDDLPDRYILNNSTFENEYGMSVDEVNPLQYINPELVTMTFEGKLYELFWYGEGGVRMKELSLTAQQNVLQNDEDFLEKANEIRKGNYIYALPDGTPSILDTENYNEEEGIWSWESYLEDEKFEEFLVDMEISEILITSSFLKEEFRRIFEGYGLYYEMGHPWSLTTYYAEELRRREKQEESYALDDTTDREF